MGKSHDSLIESEDVQQTTNSPIGPWIEIRYDLQQ